ncbi:20637_t:CDS:1, partial [Gigaspora rosea]
TTEPKLDKSTQGRRKMERPRKACGRGTRPLKNPAMADLLDSVEEIIDGREM